MPLSFLKHLFHKAKGDSFVTSSVVLFAGSVLVGGVNYLYQLFMARMLPVDKYGELQSLLAILSIVAVLSGAISMVTVKYIADFTGKNEFNKMYTLLRVFTEKILAATAIGYIIYVLLSGHIANFLNLPSRSPVILLGIALVIDFLIAINFGILRGLQKFKQLSAVNISVALSKLVSSFLLIRMGASVNGAVGAVVFATVLGYLLSFYPIRFLAKRQKEPLEGKEILRYSLPVLASLLFATLLWSADMVLVKHYFSPEVAGQYAALAMLGHIIFFIVGPIAMVMFPMAAKAHSSQNFPAKVMKKALLLSVPIGAAIVGGYFLLPAFVIKILVGSKFVSMSPYLGWFGLSMFVYSLVSLFSSYFLSVGETKSVGCVGGGVLLQIILLVWFHDTMWQVVWVMNGVMLFTLLLLVAYFVRMYYLCPKK